MVGIVAVVMRLFERYDQDSYLLGIHLLAKAMDRVTSSHLLSFVEWIISKVYQMFK